MPPTLSNELPLLVEHGPVLWYAAASVFIALSCAAFEWRWRRRTRRERLRAIAEVGVIASALEGAHDGVDVALEGTLIVGDEPAAPMRAGEAASGVSAIELCLPGAAFKRRKLRHAHRAPILEVRVGSETVVLDGEIEVESGGEERHSTRPLSSEAGPEVSAWVPAGLRRAADACAPVYRLSCAGDRVIAIGRLHRSAGEARGYRDARCEWSLRPAPRGDGGAEPARLRLVSAAPLPRTGAPDLRRIARRAAIGALIFVGTTWVAGRSLASSESSTTRLELASSNPLTRERALNRLAQRWQTQPPPNRRSVLTAASIHTLLGRCDEAAAMLLEHQQFATAREVALRCQTPAARSVAARAALADGHYAEASDLFDGTELSDEVAGRAFLAHLAAHQWERASRTIEQQDIHLPGLPVLARPCLTRALRARKDRAPRDSWWDPIPADPGGKADHAVRIARAKCQLLAADSTLDDAAATDMLREVAPSLGGGVAALLALARGLPLAPDRGRWSNWHRGMLLDWEPLIAGYETSPALARAASDRLSSQPGWERVRATAAVPVAIATEIASPRDADPWWRIVHANLDLESHARNDRAIAELFLALAVRRGARPVARRIVTAAPELADHLAPDVRRWIGLPLAPGETDEVSDEWSGPAWLVLGAAARPVVDRRWARQRLTAPEPPYTAMVRAGNRGLLAERRGDAEAAADHRARARRHYDAVMDVEIAVILRLALAY